MELPRDPRSAREARSFVAKSVSEFGMEPDPDTVLLLTSELVTNALEYGESNIVKVHVRRHGSGRLRIEVEDRSPTIPHQRNASALDEHGRGLALVDQLASDWGAHVIHTGREITKVVWFVVGDPGLA